MCFDIGIVVCGPNEALVVSGMFQVKKTNKQTNKHTKRQTDKQKTDKQTDGWLDQWKNCTLYCYIQGSGPSFKVGGRSLVFPCIQVSQHMNPGQSRNIKELLIFILLNGPSWMVLLSKQFFPQTIQKIPLNVMTLEIVTKRVYTAKVTHC